LNEEDIYIIKSFFLKEVFKIFIKTFLKTRSKKMTTKLRFAPLVRVSTETQEKKGESLKTQRKQIIEFVEKLNGIIPEKCWKYSGQEHATVGEERKKLQQLLNDSSKNLFDAVIVCDISRWSRDNLKSRQSLALLRNNGIRFFVSTEEYNLQDPKHCFILGMSTEMNEYVALELCQKSLINRINRAKNRIPTGGKLPFGRTYNKKTGIWGVNTKKARDILWAADQYLKGKSITWIGETLGMNHSNLWKILTKRSGNVWHINFVSERFGINESVPIKVPELLPQETIKAIYEKAAANKTYTHGNIKNAYLLSRMIFCADCGYAMFGQTNRHGKRYYRHARHRKKECRSSGLYVPAHDIETAILVNLFSMYGDSAALERAIKKAIPDMSELTESLKMSPPG